MEILLSISQAVAIISACWAIISGVGAWKREFIGKRKIELAEEVLATFFELKDEIAYIRNPFSNTEEGKSRERGESELPEASKLLDRGFIVFERYNKRKEIFIKFSTLKYRFMAAFGHETEKLFNDCDAILNSIFVSARMLATHYWPRQGRVKMSEEKFKKHLEEMHKHEGVFWDHMSDEDEIRRSLQKVQEQLDTITKPCFEEPMQSFELLTKKIK
jgi:hypothetical protein